MKQTHIFINIFVYLKNIKKKKKIYMTVDHTARELGLQKCDISQWSHTQSGIYTNFLLNEKECNFNSVSFAKRYQMHIYGHNIIFPRSPKS
jgi:hypothetical protein